MRGHFKSLDVEGCFVWQIHTCVQEFIRNELAKQGLELVAERHPN